jgi:hypothetical protein
MFKIGLRRLTSTPFLTARHVTIDDHLGRPTHNDGPPRLTNAEPLALTAAQVLPEHARTTRLVERAPLGRQPDQQVSRRPAAVAAVIQRHGGKPPNPRRCPRRVFKIVCDD